MLIDFHTHCFPDDLAVKAIGRLSHVSGGLEPHTDGTLAGLRRGMVEGQVDTSVVLHIATNPGQQKKVNDFAAAIHNGRDIISFGSVFPGSEDAFAELERIKELGLPGVKLHPDYQGFRVDDPQWKPLYQKISSLGLITLFHAGYDYGFAPPYGCMPQALATALDWFDSPVVAAHWGGIHCCEGVLEHLCGRDVYFDTAFGYGMMPKYSAEKILEKHGVDRILFGTDSPWQTPAQEWRLLDSLGLCDADREKIASGNAKRLLGME